MSARVAAHLQMHFGTRNLAGRSIGLVIRHMKETIDHLLHVPVNVLYCINAASSRMDHKAPIEVRDGDGP